MAHRQSERRASIKLTPAMVEAGVLALEEGLRLTGLGREHLFSDMLSGEVAERVYIAMANRAVSEKRSVRGRASKDRTDALASGN